MKQQAILLICLASVFFFCERENPLDVSCHTAYDPIADITYLKGYFYSTNLDYSMNAGSQIFLYRISNDGQILDYKIDLEMNGQGYFAMTHDGRDLYLQSRRFNSILKCSTVGEIFYHEWFVENGLACGICYIPENDSLCVLSRSLQNKKTYQLFYVNKNNPFEWSSKAAEEFAELNETTGAFAIDVKGNELFILGQDTTNTDVLLRTDLSLNIIESISLETDSITGLCIRDNDLHFGFLNKTIMKITL